MIVLPDSSRARLVQRFGTAAAAWCDELDALIAEFAGAWGLRPLDLLPAGSNSVVLRCESAEHGHAVLKLTPDPEVARQEAVALRGWAGVRQVVDLLEAEPDRGAVLLEWLPSPETLADSAWSLEEVTPLLTAVRVGPPDDAELPTLAERVKFIFDLMDVRARQLPPYDFLPGLLADGRAACLELASSGTPGLVHGDLHAGNLVRAGDGRGLVAIDPRPSLGDQTMDLVDWALDGVTDEETARRNVALLSERIPGVDRDRLWAWCRGMAVAIAVSRPDDPWGKFMLQWAQR
ncbi:aminoglycoside phosphotransferase family protein [Amycolatopsis sp. 195334CR]|uniref:aminoglycoside phosphotransferase family protein n=1 Tax=Amycolatopsis sp. 195334CR TaxID=2814588 RepID=UPI001A902C1B|nr:aminoglycoside phosphotransferase family protein [Amycolatopsis sp. 195334CR]MBN6037674.1 phosphotransferase [Amycolatopsis sp. 195334CR]